MRFPYLWRSFRYFLAKSTQESLLLTHARRAFVCESSGFGWQGAAWSTFAVADTLGIVSKDRKDNLAPRIENRRAWHDYFIEAKVECGMVLVGSEVKSLRAGKASLQEAFARIDRDGLALYQCHIDPYEKAASVNNHEPTRERKLLVHKRELKRLVDATKVKGTTLIPLAIYFKDGRAKLELGVARGKHQHDKRQTIKKKEQDRELRRMQMQRR